MGHGLVVMIHSLSSVATQASILSWRPNPSKRVLVSISLLVLLQAVLVLPLGNRGAAFYPVVMYIIVLHKAGLVRLPILGMLALAPILPVLAVVLREVRYGQIDLVQSVLSVSDSWNRFVSEAVMFDVFALLTAHVSMGLIHAGPSVFIDSLAYFLPSFLIEGPKPLPADFQLSRLLGFAGSQEYGTPPTVFGGLFWYFGLLGLLLGSALFGLAVRAANWRLHVGIGVERSRVFSILVYSLAFVFLIDLVRVGVFMREVLTLVIRLSSIFVVFALICA